MSVSQQDGYALDFLLSPCNLSREKGAKQVGGFGKPPFISNSVLIFPCGVEIQSM